MHSPLLPYPGHQDLTSQPLSNGGFRIAYHDIDPRFVHYVNNISISKGHRLVSGFFGAGLLIAGAIDWVFGPEVKSEATITGAFGLLTSFILIFIAFSRNITIRQLKGILNKHIEVEGYGILTASEEVKDQLAALEPGRYVVSIPSPFLMLKGIELIPK